MALPGCASGILSWESKGTRRQDAASPKVMSRSLSWSEHLDTLLNATDGNVARIKVRGRLRAPIWSFGFRYPQSLLVCASVSFVAAAVSSWSLHSR